MVSHRENSRGRRDQLRGPGAGAEDSYPHPVLIRTTARQPWRACFGIPPGSGGRFRSQGRIAGRKRRHCPFGIKDCGQAGIFVTDTVMNGLPPHMARPPRRQGSSACKTLATVSAETLSPVDQGPDGA